MKKFLFLFLTLTCAAVAQVVIDQADVEGLPAALAAKAPLASPNFTGTPTAPTAATGTQTTQLATTAFVEARALPGNAMSVTRDALYFGRGQSGSFAYWSNTEHAIVGTNDFTIAVPVIDWWFPNASPAAGLLAVGNDTAANYATATSNNTLTIYFETTGALIIRLSDAAPNADSANRRYGIPKANLYDIAANRPGMLIIKRTAGVLSVRLNTQAITLPAETVVGSPVSTWSGYIDSTYFRLGQIFGGAGYLGKLGVPYVYSLALTDAECDVLVTQGPRALPYRHGSFKNYAPTSGTASWQSFGSGTFSIATYDLATDADGVGIPPGGSTADYCIKITRSGASGDGGVQISNIWRQGGPVWFHSAQVKLTSLTGGAVTWGNVSGGNWAAAIPGGQTNPAFGTPGANVPLTVAEGWKTCSVTGVWVGQASTVSGPGFYMTAAATDLVAYVVVRRISPLGMLFDGVVQPNPTVRDNGPNRMTGVLVNRVDPITTLNRGTIRGQLSWSGTHEAKALIADQALIPPNASIESIVVTASANTSGTGLTIGDGDTTGHWVTSTTLTSGADKTYFLTLANRVPQSAAANDLKIYADPDSANYTGTLNVTFNYVLTY